VFVSHIILAGCAVGQLYELDGRRAGPIAHGPTSSDSLLKDVARVARDFIDQ
jgi:ubiquitin carboxyl-terminal hydrolase L3